MKIRLDRVVFIEPVNVPGPDHDDQYPTREEIIVSKARPNNRLSSKQHFNLWRDDQFVYLQHPDRPDSVPEVIPMANVLQARASVVEETEAPKKAGK